ncbi:Tripartite-type tricarboxylate transporter, receptor component TctC [Enhydrobacter aerosaccus]|uniref:Tripartite-type tricarboxylate transporter, receptor component TctC n=1 Tax=Enhydrobacter aerosaccus TaxID=225324 RepID=A0A1T4T0X1_9HYPH|nr:tripartite tricarboxylate transporter substrate binding protein [Enhydrobacter aerosaccus]SKA34136.1 Tripartite-type tricarboxylate transporter, receptor component TctC [Enhydrobacter aerosaccus]
MKRRVGLLCLSLALALPGLAFAQFPEKPIRLVVPYAPGGTTDIMARTMQEGLSKALGQTVVVDNKAGAAGAIATSQVAHSAPDGYTLIFGNNGPSAIVPLIQKDAGYDPVKDFAPVSLVSIAPLVLVVHPSVPANNVAELIAWAKTQPNGVEYATAGAGSLGHLATELFAKEAGIKLIHVPYKGQAPTTMAVLNGEVKILLTTSSDTMDAAVKAGKLKLLGVSTAKPSPLMPGAPTIGQSLKGYEVNVWFGILAPAGTPQPVIARLNEAVRTVLADPELQKKFVGFGCIAMASTPEEFAAMIGAEVPKWREIVETGHITTQ